MVALFKEKEEKMANYAKPTDTSANALLGRSWADVEAASAARGASSSSGAVSGQAGGAFVAGSSEEAVPLQKLDTFSDFGLAKVLIEKKAITVEAELKDRLENNELTGDDEDKLGEKEAEWLQEAFPTKEALGKAKEAMSALQHCIANDRSPGVPHLTEWCKCMPSKQRVELGLSDDVKIDGWKRVPGSWKSMGKILVHCVSAAEDAWADQEE